MAELDGKAKGRFGNTYRGDFGFSGGMKSVAARALMMWKDWTADKAIATIREKRSPVCLCNSHFERHLRSL
jgi:hypothetical protein